MISHHLLQCAGCSEGADSILAYVAPIGWIVTGRSGVEVPELFCVAVCDLVASERICLRVLVRRAVGFQLGDLKGRGCGVMSRASRTVFVCAAGWGAIVVLCCVGGDNGECGWGDALEECNLLSCQATRDREYQ